MTVKPTPLVGAATPELLGEGARNVVFNPVLS